MQSMPSRLLAALTHPLAPRDWLELVAPLHATDEIRARVVAVRRETHDTSTLVLRPNGRWPGHRAGQYVMVTAEIRGVRRTRCFSIASSPDRGRGPLEITVKARPGGAVTPALVEGAALGQIVTLSAPHGDFVLPEVIPEGLVLLSGGSGITPVMSMLRTLFVRRHRGEVIFVHHARSEADVIFRDELGRIARVASPNFRVLIETGPFDPARYAERVPDFEHRETWACGPERFLAAVRGAYAARDAASSLHLEAFSLGSAASSSSDDGEVTFARSGARARGAAPLLVLAERAGLSPASGCRMGICHGCTCRKLSGKTRDLRTGEVSDDAGVDIQLCVSAPVGPVEIDL
jgi:ferredoxin-NADP reductase